MARHKAEQETVTHLTDEVGQMRRLSEALQEAVATSGRSVRGQIIKLNVRPIPDMEDIPLMRVFSKA